MNRRRSLVPYALAVLARRECGEREYDRDDGEQARTGGAYGHGGALSEGGVTDTEPFGWQQLVP